MAEPIISWSAPEHYHYEKTSDWYWAVGIIAATCTVLAFIFGQIMFGIFIIVATIALCLLAAMKPHIAQYQINDRGVMINNTLYPFVSLESFWIDTLHPLPKILIKSNKMFMTYISIPIEEVDPEDVRAVLLRYIAETEHTEPVSKKLLELLGF